MIQSLRSSDSGSWLLFWLDLDEPVPTVGGDFMLPTLVVVTDGRGSPVAPPEMLEELDQTRAENLLGSLIDRHGAPGRIVISQSEEWDPRAWQAFGDDFRVQVEFNDLAGKHAEELQNSSKAIAATLGLEAQSSISQADPRRVAAGLTATASRLRSEKKKIQTLKKAADLDPNCAEARVEWADAEFRRGDHNAAARLYTTVIRTEKSRWAHDDPEWWTVVETRPFLRALYGRAMTLWHEGNYAMAGESLEELLARNPRDHQGVRFLLPLVWLLADETEIAAQTFANYDKNYPDDFMEPAFLFGRGLLEAHCSREGPAQQAYRAGIRKNLYIAPMLLEQPLPPELIWQPNDRADPTFAREFLDSYAVLWERVPAARRALREAWESARSEVDRIVAHRRMMADFQDQRYEPNYKKLWQALVEEDERSTR